MLAEITAATAGASTSYDPHTDNQKSPYASLQYKPMQFEGGRECLTAE